jgi:hypothetical protein
MQKKEENFFERSAGAKKGNWVMIDGQMCQVVDSSFSKTGKHGSAKVKRLSKKGNKVVVCATSKTGKYSAKVTKTTKK